MQETMFGVPSEHPEKCIDRKGRPYVGYAATPGTGPAGETCRSCKHKTKQRGIVGHFLKCALMENHWTHGCATDIKAKTPACREWFRA